MLEAGLQRLGLGRGAVVEVHSRRIDVVGGEGLHRVCAWGQRADWHSQGYQHLLEVDGWCLLMGVGYDSTPNSPWELVWQRADERGLIRREVIGEATCSLFKANALVSLYKDWLRADPYGLFGVEPEG